MIPVKLASYVPNNCKSYSIYQYEYKMYLAWKTDFHKGREEILEIDLPELLIKMIAFGHVIPVHFNDNFIEYHEVPDLESDTESDWET